MDKSILKKFAIESRNDLMDRMKNKINSFYIDEDFSKEQKGDMYILSNEKHSLTLLKNEYEKRELLIKRIKDLSLEQVIEESAYTWFNRIIAIRYMELNDILPLSKNNQSLGIRVLSSKENTTDPEILKFTNLMNPDLDINFNKEVYSQLKEDERFKYILLLVCNKLGKVIPQVFNGITDYIDVLMPDNLLNDTGFVNKIIKEVPIENFKEVEIIGWLYQYYNQTEKDRVISAKKAYKKNEIPYATQLFTPDWIVKYMVENSLGRYWVEHNGDGALYPSNNLYSSDNLYPSSSITDNWKYFIKDNIEKQNDKLDPTKITFIDPCCGSGHILVYAFEVFYQIYTKAGYNKNDIPELILKNNLYGLDIDDRAGQLSTLSILLKAREYDKNIFNKEIVRNLNIMSIQESKSITQENINYLKSKNDDLEAFSLNETIDYIYYIFQNAKEIGSLLIIDNKDYTKVLDRIEELNKKQLDILDYVNLYDIENNFKCLIKQAIILSKNYDIVVTNPPYMGQSKMNETIKKYLIKYYQIGKTDLCTAFMLYRGVVNNGYIAMINQQAWMSLESFENLRNYILENMNISSMIHLGFGTFGADFGTTTFVLKKSKEKKGIYVSTRNFKTSESKEEKFLCHLKNNKLYNICQNEFFKIPGNIISYWLSKNQFDTFENGELFGKYGETKKGVLSGNDKRFLRLWFELNIKKIGFNLINHSDMIEKNFKWIPVTSGGNYRKWYGNFESVINLENDGFEIKNNKENSCRLRENKYYFKECVTWSEVSMKGFSVRYVPKGILFGNSGPVCFFNKDFNYFFGLLNSKVSILYLKLLSPTLTFGPEQIKRIPVKNFNQNLQIIKDLVLKNIELMKQDWDSFETSWDFKIHPLLAFRNSIYTGLGNGYEASIKISSNKNIYGETVIYEKDKPINCLIKSSYEYWKIFTDKQFKQLKGNEEELNRIFIDIYGLQDELTPEVEDKDITIRKADEKREIKSLISYAVGCMFGRYSLDQEGLVYAGGEFDSSKYKAFNIDIDNVIPINDEVYFSDDIVSRFKEFIRVAYGSNTLNENIDFIAETLGKRNLETSEETIRRYFNNDFYNDHVKMYQKRPIYWQFDSGKKNGFKCLIYMHRYNENLIPKVRLDYLHKIQTTYEKLINDVNSKLKTELSLSDKKEAQNRLTELSNKLQETKEYDEKIAYIANQRISIDLDDGVVVNYEKFKDVLAKIK